MIHTARASIFRSDWTQRQVGAALAIVMFTAILAFTCYHIKITELTAFMAICGISILTDVVMLALPVGADVGYIATTPNSPAEKFFELYKANLASVKILVPIAIIVMLPFKGEFRLMLVHSIGLSYTLCCAISTIIKPLARRRGLYSVLLKNVGGLFGFGMQFALLQWLLPSIISSQFIEQTETFCEYNHTQIAIALLIINALTIALAIRILRNMQATMPFCSAYVISKFNNSYLY
ncbi:MAG: hypothetical protein IJU72_03425 [Bacteroidales bacterium]|nr:hypothetical protein [Bacteroidales bacterium]